MSISLHKAFATLSTPVCLTPSPTAMEVKAMEVKPCVTYPPAAGLHPGNHRPCLGPQPAGLLEKDRQVLRVKHMPDQTAT